MSWGYKGGIKLPGYDPLLVANAPTIGTATAGNSLCASVTFTAPSCTGGSVITTYTVFSNCGAFSNTGATSPIVVSGLTNAASYTFKVIATNIYGPSYPSAASNSITASNAGSQSYTTAGTYSWVAPACVTSVSVVAVGAGGGGGGGRVGGGGAQGAGAGGGLGYKNNYSVTPGNSYTVVVGAGGIGAFHCNSCPLGGNGANSYFVSTGVVAGFGGAGGRNNSYSTGGSYVGDGGGNGGNGGQALSGSCGGGGGGGGAGGYSGAGGTGGSGSSVNGSVTTGSAGSGGGAGGGAGSGIRVSPRANYRGGSGGGVGILGQGSNGAGGTLAGSSCQRWGNGGGGGSGGTAGPAGVGGACVAGVYGGGGGGGTIGNPCGSAFNLWGADGGVGAVRIIWPGNTRSFPSTCAGNP